MTDRHGDPNRPLRPGAEIGHKTYSFYKHTPWSKAQWMWIRVVVARKKSKLSK
jgi:hypothetical protein